MYFRTTTRKRGDKIYQSLHLVESYRTKEGKVRQRILVNFGSASQYSRDQIKEIIRGLQKFYQPLRPHGQTTYLGLARGGAPSRPGAERDRL